MRRSFAALIAALSVCSCSTEHECPYQLFEGFWDGSASYTATSLSEPNGISGASALEAKAGGAACSASSAFVALGGCSLAGHVTGPRSMVFDAATSSCRVQLAEERVELRVRDGSALIAANDTLQVTVGAELVSRQGQLLQDASITLAFEGRRR
jgi:hypothetical protein